MGVSKDSGIPKWMVYNGKPYQNGWSGGITIFGNIHMFLEVDGAFSMFFSLPCELQELSLIYEKIRIQVNLWVVFFSLWGGLATYIGGL